MVQTTARLGRDKRKTAIIVAAGASALALLAWLAIGQTVAGFTAQTENAGNEFEAGTVVINDDDGGNALFVFDDLLPGHVRTADITVINESTAPLKVKFFAGLDDATTITETTDTANNPTRPTDEETNIAENLLVTVRLGDATGDIVFNDTLEVLKSAVNWSSGHNAALGDAGDPIAADDEAAGGPDELVYHITVELLDTAGNEDEQVWPGDAATVTFVWEGRA